MAVADEAVKCIAKKNKHPTVACAEPFPKAAITWLLEFLSCICFSRCIIERWSSGVGRAVAVFLICSERDHPWVLILMGRWRIPWLLEFSADAFLTIPPLNKTQPWKSRRKWALLRRASLGSEDVGPETPGISSSNWTLILWPELVKHLEGTLRLNFSSSQHELSSYCFLHLQNVWLLPQGEDMNSCQTVSHIIFYLDSFNSCGIIPPFLLQLSEIPNEKLATDLGAFSLSI